MITQAGRQLYFTVLPSKCHVALDADLSSRVRFDSRRLEPFTRNGIARGSFLSAPLSRPAG